MKKFIAGLIAGVLFSFASLTVAVTVSPKLFPDVNLNEWYSQAVYNLSAAGIVNGYQNGRFGPDDFVTRAQVAVMLNKLRQDMRGKTDNVAIPQVPRITQSASPISSKGNSACASLTETQGRVIRVDTVAQLQDAISGTSQSGNATILLADGTYVLNDALWVAGPNIMIRSESGNRDRVIVKGQGMNGGVATVFQLTGQNQIIADMTLGWVANHPIQIHGELNADAPRLHNLHIVDGREQLVKVSYDANNMAQRSDSGVLECSMLEYTAGVGPQYYIGGIDAHNAANWIVRDNIFKNIRSPEDEIAEYAIHFWSDSRDTLIERNVIINSDRGIGFGMGDRGHHGGIIRDNMIYHDNSRSDVGIGLENAENAQVLNNTVFFENDYENAIEYRFAGSRNITIKGNRVNRAITSREGGRAAVTENRTDAVKSMFASVL